MVDAELEALQRETFRYFLHETNPHNGLVRDKTATDWPSSIAATGLGLAVYPVAVERGFITRTAAVERILTTLRFFWNSRQGPEPDATGYHGFYYHFLDMQSGRRAWQCELSTVDSTILLAGALTAGAYFDADTTEEKEIRALADALYRRVDWPWAQNGGLTVTHGWKPESGFLQYRWEGYDEALVLYILGLGSPTYPLPRESYAAWASTYEWKRSYRYDYLYAGPLFTHQISHVWIDFRGIQDAFMRDKGIDYFENTRRAVYAQRAFAIANPNGFHEYGANVWGFTACDGPGKLREFDRTNRFRYYLDYSARGAGRSHTIDDGTIAPTAVLSSLPFAPEIVIPAVELMHARYGKFIYSKFGFVDSFNRSLTATDAKLSDGRIDPAFGWVASDCIGIDQGPILAMIANFTNGSVWQTMTKCAQLRRGLQRAGFTGGWLEED